MNNFEAIRINKFLSDSGLCSRREADRLIASGRVSVNGQAALPGQKVGPQDDIRLDGSAVKQKDPPALYLFHKPRGVVVSTVRQFQETIIMDCIDLPFRVFPVGRLDKESEGLLLLTNQGDMVNRLLKSAGAHEKEYVVTIDRPVTEDFLRKMSAGVPILDTVTKPCRTWKTDKNTFHIILTQGLNRQIRRMCEYLGCHVTRLIRIRILNLELGNLPPGTLRPLTPSEESTFRQKLS